MPKRDREEVIEIVEGVKRLHTSAHRPEVTDETSSDLSDQEIVRQASGAASALQAACVSPDHPAEMHYAAVNALLAELHRSREARAGRPLDQR